MQPEWPLRVASIALLVVVFYSLAQAASPSFDCAKASGQVEQLICKDEALADLDHKMGEIYSKALKAWPPEEVTKQRAMQRGWIKGRNDCWKAEDVRNCVEASYRTRIVEMQIQFGQLLVPTPIGYVCRGGEDKPFFATFYKDTDPPSVVLTYGNDQVIAFSVPSGSGAKYTTAQVMFWEHHGEATVEWFGAKLSCITQ